jgi:hypothetical protein
MKSIYREIPNRNELVRDIGDVLMLIPVIRLDYIIDYFNRVMGNDDVGYIKKQSQRLIKLIEDDDMKKYVQKILEFKYLDNKDQEWEDAYRWFSSDEAFMCLEKYYRKKEKLLNAFRMHLYHSNIMNND